MAKRAANAQPSGGGGGGWKQANESLAKRRASLQQTASKEGGLALGTTIHPYDGTDPQTEASATGTSIFDPVLCEIAYRWFCPDDGVVLDPFAGGSVRGIVASRLRRLYFGIELRPEQVEANRAQLKIAGTPKPEWIVGDARDTAKIARAIDADFVLSCPPYWNLEVYSEDPADLSTFGKEEFFEAQAQAIAGAVSRLKDNRFAMWVVGDVRDDAGYYVNMAGRTVAAFEAAGARLYNHAILVTAAGSLPIRVRKQFESGRKLGKTHQDVLVFCKGDWKKAVGALGKVEFGEVDAEVHRDSALAALGNIGGEVS